MISLRLDTTSFSKTMRNAISYSNGFMSGAEKNRSIFNAQLGEIAVKMLGEYIDTRARISPDALHHVYEWGRTGDSESRLFEFESKPTQRSIWISGQFLPSKSTSDGSTEPFIDKANIMENAIAIEITPRASGVLAFEDDGQTIFTTNSIYISNPGGDEVAGSFGEAVNEFFNSYFTPMVLVNSGILKDMETAEEFSQYFSSGAKSGYSVGSMAGKKYMTIGQGRGL